MGHMGGLSVRSTWWVALRCIGKGMSECQLVACECRRAAGGLLLLWVRGNVGKVVSDVLVAFGCCSSGFGLARLLLE